MDSVDRKKLLLLSLFLLLSGMLPSCSINQLVVRRAGNVLAGASGGTNVFTSDNDPELIAQALPLVLKLQEALLEEDPANRNLWLATASGYVSYANAFLQTPATMLPSSEYLQKEATLARAKNLYIRGRDMALQGLAISDSRFLQDPRSDEFAAALRDAGDDDVPLLYWAAAGWLGALSADPFDMSLNLSRNLGAAIMERAYALDPEYDDGAIHEFFIAYHAAQPDDPVAGRERARFHYREAIRLSRGRNSSPYVSLGEAVKIAEQDLDGFVLLMEAALQVDPEQAPHLRLVNTIRQRQARWYLDNLERFFLDAGSWDEDWAEDWDEDWDD